MPHKDPEALRAYRREYMRRYRAANREKVLAYHREWNRQNRDPDKQAAKMRALYRGNPAYRAAAIERANAWTKANPERVKAARRRRYDTPEGRAKGHRDRWVRLARLAGAAGSCSTDDWRRLVNRYDGCCAYCGDRPSVLHVDHVIPLSRGGSNSIGNLLPACGSCNGAKGAKLLIEWRRACLPV